MFHLQFFGAVCRWRDITRWEKRPISVLLFDRCGTFPVQRRMKVRRAGQIAIKHATGFDRGKAAVFLGLRDIP